MRKIIIALALIVPCLAHANVYLTTTGAGVTNAITFTPAAGSLTQIRTTSSGQETSTTTVGNHALSINAGAGGTLNLNTLSSGQVVIGLNSSTFSASGSLSLANNASLNLSGVNGNFTGTSSVTASAFFGDGSALSGIPAGYLPNDLPINVDPATALNTISLSATQLVMNNNQMIMQTPDFQLSPPPGHNGAFTIPNGDNSTRYQIVVGDSFDIDEITGNPQVVSFTKGAPTDSLFMSASGNIGLGTGSPINTLEVNGGINVDNTKNCGTALQTDSNGQIICSVSDAKMKTNIAPLTTNGSVIDAINPHFFTYKNASTHGNQQHAGFIAEEVAAVFPQAAVSAGYEMVPSTYSIWHAAHTFTVPVYQPGHLDAKGHRTFGKTVMQTRTSPGYWTKAPPTQGAALLGVESNALTALLWTEVQNLRKKDSSQEAAIQGLLARVSALEAAQKK